MNRVKFQFKHFYNLYGLIVILLPDRLGQKMDRNKMFVDRRYEKETTKCRHDFLRLSDKKN